jgi:hypothetical protein
MWDRTGCNSTQGFEVIMTASEEKLIGIAWFCEEEWAKLRDVVDDKTKMEDSYEAWRTGAEQLMVDLLLRGIQAEPVYIRVEELVDWCQENGRTVNANAASDYVAERMQSIFHG